jgi:chloramphenicol-sensitive protein RarD
MENRKHYIAAVSAFIIWGFFSIPLRALSDYSAGEILYFRILFSLLVLAIVILTLKRGQLHSDYKRLLSLPQDKRRNVVLLTLAGGALLCVNWLTFIYIVNNINIKTASFSYLICPVITAILGYVLIAEKLSRQQWFAVVLCALSCLLMGLNSSLELGYSMLTALTYALYLISQRKNQGYDRIIVLGVQVLFSFIILSFMFPLLVKQVPIESNFYVIIILIAAMFTVLPLFLNLFALNKINSATIGILMYLNPLINFSVAFLVYDEKASALQIGGYIIIIIALVIFNLANFKKLQGALSASRASA